MPKVGPIEGWRMAMVADEPMCWNAWPRPTVVVVLPSQAGWGDGGDDDVLRFGRSAIFSMASSVIFAAPEPYGSRHSAGMPALAAISVSGRRSPGGDLEIGREGHGFPKETLEPGLGSVGRAYQLFHDAEGFRIVNQPKANGSCRVGGRGQPPTAREPFRHGVRISASKAGCALPSDHPLSPLPARGRP